MLRGSSKIQLSQLDLNPALQAGAMEAQAAVNLAGSINDAVLDFQAKQEEKAQRKMTANALREFIPGLGEDVYTAISKDPQILKSMSDLTNIQTSKAQQEESLLQQQRIKQEMEIVEEGVEERQRQQAILEQAIFAHTDTSGMVDKDGVKETFIQLGGTDESVLGLLNTPGEIKIDPETGVITQGGELFNILPQAALDKPPSEYEQKTQDLNLQILELQRKQLELQNQNLGFQGTSGNIDVSKLEGSDLQAYNEAIKAPLSAESQQIFQILLSKQQENQ